MKARPTSLLVKRPDVRAALALAGCALTLSCAAQAYAEDAQPTGAGPTPPPGAQSSPGAVSALLEQCLTTGAQAERAATFSGEMSTVPGAARMQMRIDVEERLPDGTRFHTVTAPGLGAWRSSAPGVKSYKYLRQVTNLSAPATYRGAIHFRWFTARGVLIKVLDRRTPDCEQPAAPAPEVTTGPGALPGTGTAPAPGAPTTGLGTASSGAAA